MLESAYEECLCHELTFRKLNFEGPKPRPLICKEAKLDCGYRLDVLLEGKIVVEPKLTDGLGPIQEAITLTHLKLSGHKLGLLISFNVPLPKDGIKRFVTPN